MKSRLVKIPLLISKRFGQNKKDPAKSFHFGMSNNVYYILSGFKNCLKNLHIFPLNVDVATNPKPRRTENIVFNQTNESTFRLHA